MNKKLIKNKNKILINGLTAGILFILVGYILMPALHTLALSLLGENGMTLAHYKEFFAVDLNITVLKNTFLLGISTVVVCGAIGTTLAFAVHYFDFPLKKIVKKLLMMPMVLPGIIIVIAFIQLYGESGLVTKSIQILFQLEEIPFRFTGFWGILFVHAYTQYIYFYLNVSVAIQHMDNTVIEAAKNLGASKLQIFRTIILPFIRPALLSASIITFMSGIGSFSAPSLIGDRFKVLTTQILFAKSNQAMAMASVEVILLSLMSITVLLLVRYYEKKNLFVQSVRGVAITPKRIENRGSRAFFLIGVASLMILILLPIIVIVMLSFVKPGTWMIEIFPSEFALDNYIKIATNPRALSPFINSIIMSLLAILMVFVIALPCSYMITKTKNKLNPMIELLTMLPWAIPASAMGINLINYFNKRNIFALNQILVGSYIILPLAYFISILPLVIRSINLSMSKLNDSYEEVSRTLGAKWITTLKRVVIPIISPGILSGLIVGFIRCIGEYTLSLYLFTTGNKPISIAMVNGVFEYDLGLAMAYGVLTILLTISLLSMKSRID